MKSEKNILKNKKFHLVGINGISMSAIAKYLLLKKREVSGSDTVINKVTHDLQKKGVKFYLGHFKESVIDKEVVVYTSAVDEENPEIIGAKNLGLKVVSRGVFLGEILKNFNDVILVSGSHGKTTTTSMLSEVFIKAKLNPTVFLGGESDSFGNFRSGKNKLVIAEACEYKKNFLFLPHNISVVLNVDNDHLDSFNGLPDIIRSFNEFISNGVAFINADDKNCRALFSKSLVTFGIKNNATFMAKNIIKKSNGYSYNLYEYGQNKGRINLNVLGKHNVYNSLATCAVAISYGISFKDVKYALERFSNVKRRNEFLGKIKDMRVFADYAHHPSELRESINTFVSDKEKSLIIFQPHTYSRTKFLMKDFVNVLEQNDVYIYKTYPAREEYDEMGDGKTLADNLRKRGANVEYFDNFDDLMERVLENNTKYKKLVFVGAGDVYEKICNFLKNFIN